jgi:hypothetical protein
LGRRLGVTQTPAWKMKHKLAQVMMERDATKRLSGRVELDDAFLGGERSGGKRGRGAPGSHNPNDRQASEPGHSVTDHVSDRGLDWVKLRPALLFSLGQHSNL